MFTVVYTPGVVCTLINISLRTVTMNVVQPNLSNTDTVVVVCLCSNISDSITSSYNRSETNSFLSVDRIRNSFIVVLN